MWRNCCQTDVCIFLFCIFIFHALLLTEHTARTLSHTHSSPGWVASRTAVCLYGSWHGQLPLITLDQVAYSMCVCVFLCVPGALQSLALCSVWFSWWALWRPCACACACAWRMGEGHVLACSAPPISILWPRAIQVGLQKRGAQEMEFTRKQNGRCQRWRLVQENKREREKKTSESDGIKTLVLGKRRMIIWMCMFWIIRI